MVFLTNNHSSCVEYESRKRAGRRSGEGGLMVLPCHLGNEILIILSQVDETTSKCDLQKTGTLSFANQHLIKKS